VLHRNNNVGGKAKILSSCSAFVVTANAFPGFGTHDYLVARKRELTCFLWLLQGHPRGQDNEHCGHRQADNEGESMQQELRKKVLHELIDGASNPTVDEEVTDMEWFYLVSMTHSFTGDEGVSSHAFMYNAPVWLSGSLKLESFGCQRARQASQFTIHTMVCIPTHNGCGIGFYGSGL
jgi:hypothetical protein